MQGPRAAAAGAALGSSRPRGPGSLQTSPTNDLERQLRPLPSLAGRPGQPVVSGCLSGTEPSGEKVQAMKNPQGQECRGFGCATMVAPASAPVPRPKGLWHTFLPSCQWGHLANPRAASWPGGRGLTGVTPEWRFGGTWGHGGFETGRGGGLAWASRPRQAVPSCLPCHGA